MNRRIIRQQTHRAASATLLVVGEGADDKAFITHLKSLYCPRGSGHVVKVEAGDGGSAGVVINHAIRSFKGQAYDRRVLVLDEDLPPSAAESHKARQAGYEIILWSPQCLEGALLTVLGEQVNPHETSQHLKQRLHHRLNGPHTQAAAYAQLFPLALIDQTHNASLVAIRDRLANRI